MTTDFVRFTEIYTNCSEIQNMQNLWFEFQNNLCKPDQIRHFFLLIGDKIC